MSRFSEESFKHWHRPASETEEERISNAISMIKDGIDQHNILKYKDIEIFVQGSYANNTNVRMESDIDICVMLKDTFFSSYPEGKSRIDYGFTQGSNNFTDYRSWVISAMTNKFGPDGITVGNKSIKIHSNSYHVQADVVPAFQYRNYSRDKQTDPLSFEEGIQFFSSKGEKVINYPKIHIANGRRKNKATSKRFKKMVRIFKRIKTQMKKEGWSVNKSISSFLISGFIWNVPNSIFNDHDNWEERMRAAIFFLWEKTKNETYCKDWGEVSEKFYLFHYSRKWTVSEVNAFLKDIWNFLEFK